MMFDSTTTNDHFSSLGLSDDASWDQIERAYRSLVADLTPGPNASHGNVRLALAMLSEVNDAYHSLSLDRVA